MRVIARAPAQSGTSPRRLRRFRREIGRRIGAFWGHLAFDLSVADDEFLDETGALIDRLTAWIDDSRGLAEIARLGPAAIRSARREHRDVPHVIIHRACSAAAELAYVTR
jgi:hypothetical protein